MKNTHTFTVFTPTYNRAKILPRAFESLQCQSFQDFEWLVIDDGSTDNTKDVVEELAKKAFFPVRYLYQTHGHKKKAINYGAREARGKFFLFLDSDDQLTDNTLERFNFHWKSIPLEKRKKFCGVFGLTKLQTGEIMGKLFPEYRMESSFNEMNYLYKSFGERSMFFVTDVLKKYSFPENISGLVPEGFMWSRISRTYAALFVNEALRIYFISEDAITPKKRFGSFAKERAEGRAFCASELLTYELPLYFRFFPKVFCIEALMYVRSAFHIFPKKPPKVQSKQGLFLVLLLSPFGVVLALLDKFSMHREYTPQK